MIHASRPCTITNPRAWYFSFEPSNQWRPKSSTHSPIIFPPSSRLPLYWLLANHRSILGLSGIGSRRYATPTPLVPLGLFQCMSVNSEVFLRLSGVHDSGAATFTFTASTRSDSLSPEKSIIAWWLINRRTVTVDVVEHPVDAPISSTIAKSPPTRMPAGRENNNPSMASPGGRGNVHFNDTSFWSRDRSPFLTGHLYWTALSL